MQKIIKINDLYINLTYQFNEYFKDTFLKYEVNEYPQDIINMTVLVKNEIVLSFEDKKIFRNNNQIIYETSHDKYIVTYLNDFSEIKHVIHYSLDYKNIEIILNNKIGNKLSEYEYVLTGMMFLELAVHNNYLPLHASAFSVGKYTILLSAPSGIGKSTQTRFFKETYKDIILINEDKPLLKLIDGHFYVVGTPWSGKDVINSNVIKKVDGIFFLNQADELNIVSLSEHDKIRHIFKNIQRPVYQDLVEPLTKMINLLINSVNISMFNCINDKESAQFLYNYLEVIDENKV